LFTQTGPGRDIKPVRGKNSNSYFATFDDATSFAQQLKAEHVRRGFYRAKQLIIIEDGAKWIWGIADKDWPQAVQIVDYYHAREHVHHIVDQLRFMTSKQHGDQLAATLIGYLDHGDIESMATEINVLHLKPKLVERLDKELDYFRHNQHRMRYGHYKKKGWFIGSGQVESACKTIVAQRAQQAGMRWTTNGLNPIITLRALHQSGRDHLIWEHNQSQTHTAQTHNHKTDAHPQYTRSAKLSCKATKIDNRYARPGRELRIGHARGLAHVKSSTHKTTSVCDFLFWPNSKQEVRPFAGSVRKPCTSIEKGGRGYRLERALRPGLLMATRHGTQQRHPTIQDVSVAAGVSRGTVSRVINGGHWVSPQAYAKVAAAIEATGYRPNHAARSLARGRTGSVGFLLSEPQQLLFSDPNFAVLLRETTRALGEHDIPLVLMMAATQQERQRITRYLDSGPVDGVFLISPHKDDPLARMLVEHKVPAVCCGKPLGHEGKLSYVTSDDFQGAYTMTAYLVERGCQHIAMITGPKDTAGGVYRLAGYQEALGNAADARYVATGDYSRRSGIQAMEDLLSRGIMIDAVFAASDLMAAGAIEVLREQNFAIPEDIAVTGFDDTGLAAELRPPLTTMHQEFDRIADEMVRLLLSLLDGAGPAASLLIPTLVKRQSA